MWFFQWMNPVKKPPTLQYRVVQTTSVSETPTHTPTPTPTIAPTQRPTITTAPTLTPTHTPIPTTVPTAVPKQADAPLLTEVNSYRTDNGKASLQPHGLLCRIAAERVAALVSRGSLDNHEGITAYKDELFRVFSTWWEVIFSASPAFSSTDVVRKGWANSPSHKESLLHSEAVFGCGAEKQGYAVFLLSK